MGTTQKISDKLSISLSMLCAIHCLAVPLILALQLGIVALHLDHQAFHSWTLLAVIPTSIYALTIGCKQHKRYRFLVMGGASLVAAGHIWNFFLCRRLDCACPDHC